MIDDEAIVAELLGSCAGAIEMREIGIHYGLRGENIDLQVGIIAEENEVWRCDSCDWWVEESCMHNDICNDCYAACGDE